MVNTELYKYKLALLELIMGFRFY